MADGAESPLTPTKSSTVSNLLSGVKTSFTNLFASSSSATAKTAADGSSSSVLTSPLLWGGAALVVAVVVYFKKFRSPARKGTKFRR